MATQQGNYFIPKYSKLPILTAFGLFLMGYGSIHLFYSPFWGPLWFTGGALVLICVLFAWFRSVIKENQARLYNDQVDRSFRWGMVWFLFADAFLFGAFFFALIYIRFVIVPYLGGEYNVSAAYLTHILLWPNFNSTWPLLANPNPSAYPSFKDMLDPWAGPAVNTLILLISAAILTSAYRFLKQNKPVAMLLSMLCTIFFGTLFLGYLVQQLMTAYYLNELRFNSGIYGNIFYMLTGLYAAHIFVGLIFLMIIFIRVCLKSFTINNYFSLEAVTWFWYLLTVIWLFIFGFVYWV